MINIKQLISALLISITMLSANLKADSAVATSGKPIVTLHTTMGNIVLQLDSERAPVTVANFLQYVQSGFYEGTVFHRVIPRFMIQGGGLTPQLDKRQTLEPIVNESNNRWHNERGTIAMARTNDPNSATSQFFINARMNASLDYRYRQPGYAVFGEVIEGMEVVDSIAFARTRPVAQHQNVPIEPIVINKVTTTAQSLLPTVKAGAKQEVSQ